MSETETDTGRFRPLDIAAAIGLLTRLPFPVPEAAFARGKHAVWAYPLAGAAVAFCAALLAGAALWLGLAPALAAGLALTAQIVLTGALHEDGLADCADGFWGGWERARRLEIMKDSRIGSYGVLALVLGVGLRWVALSTLFTDGWFFAPLLVSGMISRAAMPVLMALLPNARKTGLSHHVGRPGWAEVVVGTVLAIGISAAMIGPGIVLAVLAAVGAAFGMALLAKERVGGQTGDVLGATQQLCEIAILIALTV